MMLVSLAAQQQLMGASVVIGSIRKPALPEKPLESESLKRGIPVRAFEMKPGPNILGAYEILRYAQLNKFDVIHSHGYKTNILLGLLPKGIRRIPIITTLHGWTSTSGWTKMRVNEFLDSIALKFVDRIVLVNQGMLDRRDVQKLPQRRIRVINNGIDLLEGIEQVTTDDEDTLQKQRIESFCASGIILLSIGRLSIEKGYNFLIEAVALLRNEHKQNIKLLLIGDGRLRSDLQGQAESYGIVDSFLITGYLKNARNFISKADVYIISSLTEGLPITLLEAMLSGTPVIATAVGGIPYVAEDGTEALLVSPGNPQELVQAIQRLIDSPELARDLSLHAKEKIRQNYSSEEMAKRYLAVYDEVFESDRGRG